MGVLLPQSLIISSLAAKPGLGEVCWLQARRAAAGDTNLESDVC